MGYISISNISRITRGRSPLDIQIEKTVYKKSFSNLNGEELRVLDENNINFKKVFEVTFFRVNGILKLGYVRTLSWNAIFNNPGILNNSKPKKFKESDFGLEM